MKDLTVHFSLPFAVVVAITVAVVFTLVRGLLMYTRPAERRASLIDTSFNAQGIVITLFCALYLITEFGVQGASLNPTMPTVPNWMLVLLGMSNALDIGRRFMSPKQM